MPLVTPACWVVEEACSNCKSTFPLVAEVDFVGVPVFCIPVFCISVFCISVFCISVFCISFVVFPVVDASSVASRCQLMNLILINSHIVPSAFKHPISI